MRMIAARTLRQFGRRIRRAGNKFRLVVRIDYPYRVVYARFVGTHAEYDAIDVDMI